MSTGVILDHVRGYPNEIHQKPQLVFHRSDFSWSADGFATRHNTGFLHQPRLVAAYENAFHGVPQWACRHNRDNQAWLWRAHIVTWAANRALVGRTNLVEIGVDWGILSSIICNYHEIERFSDSQFHLFDTWGKSPGSHPWYTEDIFEPVARRFSQWPNVHLVRGLVPDSIKTVNLSNIGYLSIDLNGSTAERASLELLWPLLAAGAVIYFDDFNWMRYRALRQTIRHFLRGKDEQLLHFPSGNAILIKA